MLLVSLRGEVGRVLYYGKGGRKGIIREGKT